jgi:hypothetical protein
VASASFRARWAEHDLRRQRGRAKDKMLTSLTDCASYKVRAITGAHITNFGTGIAGMRSMVPLPKHLAYRCAGDARMPDPVDLMRAGPPAGEPPLLRAFGGVEMTSGPVACA